MIDIELTLNGRPRRLAVDPRESLVDALRERARLTGAHVGCRTASCGACTVELDGNTVKSCCVLAAEADGRAVRTVENGAEPGELDDVQVAFAEAQGMQCGYCTPGMVVSVRNLLDRIADPDDDEITRGLAGNLCRCTGYVNILKAVRLVRDRRLGRV
ncbi:(2Fe-2S)-binding protein [Herbiconiux sp. CPCC 203407]|uniref:(2Fe-2S)-binding protein n=1 Tax=Herbiconiux oxytropis TaxID=2970915 RepID=A0AA41XJI0_9MICO|nr:(2Fe-2S)-binding protein [Herbiconiux oxytropis]MCS5723219.1 (2Fe-2S)-binding protein [Herbiconiux oxytropis]MCS5727874.1 (2Fe-2S)-binding protein [Herbiconiux oxytropis]